MTFAQPLWIIIGLLCCSSLAFIFMLLKRNRLKRLELITSPHLRQSLTANISHKKRHSKQLLYILAVFCCFIALARPQYSFKWVDVKRQGIDILFALDVSKSMLAEDIRPNRLERAKYGIVDFIKQLEGDRVGLLPFAGTSFLLCPLTIDYNAFEQSLSAIDTNIIPQGGTDIATTIKDAEQILTNSSNHKILIIISDGEELEGQAITAAKEAAENGMLIFTVGVGTSSGELIPATTEGQATFIKDHNGQFVRSRLDENTLKQIARHSGGLYAPLGPGGEGLSTIYQEKLTLIPEEEIADHKQKVPLERFEWPIALALFVLVIEFLLSSRKTIITHPKNGYSTRKLTTIMIIFALFSGYSILAILPDSALASAGEESYATGDYKGAAEFYTAALTTKPADPTLLYNLGATHYKNQLFSEAQKEFEQALTLASPTLQQKCLYNLGNTLYQIGNQKLSSSPQETIELWENSLLNFQGAIALNKNDDNAIHNHKFVEDKLKQLKEQQSKHENQQPPQSDDKEGKDDNNQEEKKQDKKNQSKNDQNPDDKKDPSQQSSPDNNGVDKNNNTKPETGSDEEQKDKQEPSSDKHQGKEDETKPKPAENEIKGSNNKESSSGNGQQAQTPNPQLQPVGMTKEEATQLLDSLTEEEGNLNYILAPKRDDETTNKDW